MIQPDELKLELPMKIANGVLTTTTKAWQILVASKNGNLEAIKKMVDECPELIYAQYNYTPPIHFAVREGHIDLVSYLLDNGAHDPTYRIYPFLDSLQTLANDRGFTEIEQALNNYANDASMHKYKGDNGQIFYNRTEKQQEFEDAVHKSDSTKTAEILKLHPEFALDETYFWGEGILMKPVQHQERALTELLLSYGAKVPDILKWTQAYYFKFYDSAAHIMAHGMNSNTMSWHHVTILHDMAQKGFIDKAELLVKYGADINPIEEEYQSTPLGMAARWGHVEMVDYLIGKGADLNKSGASWATPLEWAKKKQHVEIERMLINAGAR